MENQPLYDLLAGRYTRYEPESTDNKTVFLEMTHAGVTITYHHATGQVNFHHFLDMHYGLEAFRAFMLSDGVLEAFNAHEYKTQTAASVSWPQNYSSELARSDGGGWNLIPLQTVDIGFSPDYLKSLQEQGGTGSISDMRAKKAGVELTRAQKLQTQFDRAILSRIAEFFAHGKATRQPVDVPLRDRGEGAALLDRLMEFSIKFSTATADVPVEADTSPATGPLRRLGQVVRSTFHRPDRKP